MKGRKKGNQTSKRRQTLHVRHLKFVYTTHIRLVVSGTVDGVVGVVDGASATMVELGVAEGWSIDRRTRTPITHCDMIDTQHQYTTLHALIQPLHVCITSVNSKVKVQHTCLDVPLILGAWTPFLDIWPPSLVVWFVCPGF